MGRFGVLECDEIDRLREKLEYTEVTVNVVEAADLPLQGHSPTEAEAAFLSVLP